MTFEEEIRERLVRIETKLDVLLAKPAQAPRPAPTGRKTEPGAMAPDSDLDGQWGNPAVRRDPARWPGDSHKGEFYSDCPPNYLDSLAGFLDWCADRDEEKGTEDGAKYARYGRMDAARARGWAHRIRSAQPNGELFPGDEEEQGPSDFPQDDFADDDIPF